MKFDQYGKRIKGNQAYRPSGDGETVVADLKSRHSGISDSHLDIALDTIPPDMHEAFHELLHQIEADQDSS